jgi:hypothetical protein
LFGPFRLTGILVTLRIFDARIEFVEKIHDVAKRSFGRLSLSTRETVNANFGLTRPREAERAFHFLFNALHCGGADADLARLRLPALSALPISLSRLLPEEQTRLRVQRSTAVRVPVTLFQRNALHQGVAIDVNLKLANVAGAVGGPLEGKESRAGQAHPGLIVSISA